MQLVTHAKGIRQVKARDAGREAGSSGSEGVDWGNESLREKVVQLN